MDITLSSGKVVKNCKITRVEPDGITVMHAAGVAKLPFPSLPDEYKVKYHYDPTNAATYSQTVAEARYWQQREQQDSLREKQAEEEDAKQLFPGMTKGVNRLAERRRAGTATTADCEVLKGCTKAQVKAVMGIPDMTLDSGSIYVYQDLIDRESRSENSVHITFEDGLVSRVYW